MIIVKKCCVVTFQMKPLEQKVSLGDIFHQQYKLQLAFGVGCG